MGTRSDQSEQGLVVAGPMGVENSGDTTPGGIVSNLSVRAGLQG